MDKVFTEYLSNVKIVIVWHIDKTVQFIQFIPKGPYMTWSNAHYYQTTYDN